MAAVTPTVTDFGPLRIASWVGLDGGDTGSAVEVRGYGKIVLMAGGTFADNDTVTVRGADETLANPAAGTAGDWPDPYGTVVSPAAVTFAATEEAFELKSVGFPWLSLAATAGGVAGPSAIDIFMVALRTQDY